MMHAWDSTNFHEMLGEKHDYSICLGRSLSGKSEIAKALEKHCGYTVIDFKAVEEDLKKRLSTEDNEVEEVPLIEV